jgi:hypothetical protein
MSHFLGSICKFYRKKCDAKIKATHGIKILVNFVTLKKPNLMGGKKSIYKFIISWSSFSMHIITIPHVILQYNFLIYLSHFEIIKKYEFQC